MRNNVIYLLVRFNFCLQELEKLASRKLRISAKETMKIAEKLYTQGYAKGYFIHMSVVYSMSVLSLHKSACLFPSRFISYPRTETNIFPQNLNLTMLVEQQTQDNEWGNFAQRILESGGPTPRNGNKSDQAHPPIHPTKYTNSLQVSNLPVWTIVTGTNLHNDSV